MIDLHLHSTASDGLLSPGKLAARAAKAEPALVALTDHDTLDGLAEFRAAGIPSGVDCVDGVELSLDFEYGELHLLGLGIDPQNPRLNALLTRIRASRDSRNAEIFNRLRELGIDLDYEQWRTQLATPSPGRPHIADLLIERGMVKSRREAFAVYLSEGRPLFLPRVNPALAEGIEAVAGAGGLPVVAHPLSLRISTGKLVELLPRWKSIGIRGVETIHPSSNRQQSLRLGALVDENGLLSSGGSDYHGTAEERRSFGRTAWGRPIPEDLTIIPLLRERSR